VPRGVYLGMFVRKKRNKSGTTSVQIILKDRGRYKVVKTIGCSDDVEQVQKLIFLGKQEIERLSLQKHLFASENDTIVEQVFGTIANSGIRTVGPEIIFGKIYDSIGFNHINEELFRHLVIARLAFPLSKLKTIEYLYRYQGITLDPDMVYRFLDRAIYHGLKHRIKAHICISFTAYSIYKELERILYKEKSTLSVRKAAELTHNMYQLTFMLPESKHTKSILLKMDDQQAELF